MAQREVLQLRHHAWVDLRSCTGWANERPFALTGREFRVLENLARAPGRFHTPSETAQEIAQVSRDVEPNSIEQTISGLRRKLMKQQMRHVPS